MFTRITLPNVRRALLHWIVLARVQPLGEFGAVDVVSGHIDGATDTMPLRIEKRLQEYRQPASMAMASVLRVIRSAAMKSRWAHVFLPDHDYVT